MTMGEQLYLGMVLVGFVIFGVTLLHSSTQQARVDRAAGIRNTASPNSGQHQAQGQTQGYAHA